MLTLLHVTAQGARHAKHDTHLVHARDHKSLFLLKRFNALGARAVSRVLATMALVDTMLGSR